MVKDELVYSTNSPEHINNIMGESFDTPLATEVITIPKENLCQCGQDEIYSKTLTNNLCLNCYHIQQNEQLEMDKDWDYRLSL